MAGSLRKYQYKSINYIINSTFRKIFNTRSQETVDVCFEMFGCLRVCSYILALEMASPENQLCADCRLYRRTFVSYSRRSSLARLNPDHADKLC